MAGTLFGLPLSQRVDLNGLPSIGWLLYIYQANTSTPVNSYQDTALTVLNPWPVPADASGMMRQFWLADGSYRARATNSDGSLTYFDQQSILALGASAGAAPSGGVDPNAIFQTGDVMWLDRSGVRNGWVRDNGRTIGSATSGADERANADCQALFQYLWNNYADTICPVITGRGASSLADWTANKKITMPSKRGLAAFGLDDMGNSTQGAFDFVPFTIGDELTPGAICGENSHVLTVFEMPSHDHTGSGTTGGQSNTHTHTQVASVSTGQYSAGGSNGPLGSGSQTGVNSVDHTHTFTFESDPTGDDSGHNNMPGAVLGTFYRKL